MGIFDITEFPIETVILVKVILKKKDSWIFIIISKSRYDITFFDLFQQTVFIANQITYKVFKLSTD
jgi:hypothetical protein